MRNISLSIPKGSRVAFVGPSGAGKSTLVDVIMGSNTTAGYDSIAGSFQANETFSGAGGASANTSASGSYDISNESSVCKLDILINY